MHEPDLGVARRELEVTPQVYEGGSLNQDISLADRIEDKGIPYIGLIAVDIPEL